MPRVLTKKEEQISLNELINTISLQKNLKKQEVVELIKSVLFSAARKACGYDKEIEVHFDEDTQDFKIFDFRVVVENPSNEKEVALEQARESDPGCEIGDEIGLVIPKDKLTRISANLAKQVLNQRIHIEEKKNVINEFLPKIGQLINGKVKRIVGESIYFDIGSTEAILLKSDQSSKDNYKKDEGYKLLIKDVIEKSYPQVIVSRSKPELVSSLLEEQVSELYQKSVEIKSIVRIPGVRTKIAVSSRKPEIDPVSICVGLAGLKIKPVSRELRGERVDLIRWDDDDVKFLCNSLKPIEPNRIIVDKTNRIMECIVSDEDFPLVLGKNGSNVKLVSKLIGWKIKVFPRWQYDKDKKSSFEQLSKLGINNEILLESMFSSGLKTIDDVDKVDLDFLKNIPGFNEEIARSIKEKLLV